jgi:AcrR family transcriptional regulator
VAQVRNPKLFNEKETTQTMEKTRARGKAQRVSRKAAQRTASAGASTRPLSAGERTFDALIKSGSALLAKKGLANLSLRMIAKYAGYSPAVVYKHFPDKYALFQAIREVEFIPYTKGLERIYGRVKDPSVRILEMAKSALSFSENRGVVFGFDFLSASAQPSVRNGHASKQKGFESSPSAGRIEKLLTNAVEAYFDTLPRRPIDPVYAAHQIFCVVLGVTALPSASVNGPFRDKTTTLVAMITALMKYWRAEAHALAEERPKEKKVNVDSASA